MKIVLKNQEHDDIELDAIHINTEILYNTCEYVCLTFIDLQNVLDRRILVQIYNWQTYYTNIYFTNILSDGSQLQKIIKKINIISQLNFHKMISGQQFSNQTLIFDKNGEIVYDEYLFQKNQLKIIKALNKFQHIPDQEEIAKQQEEDRIRKEQEEQLRRIQEMNFTVLQSQSQIKMVDVSEEDKYLSSPLHFLSSCIILNSPNPYKAQPIIIFYLNTQISNINYYLDFVIKMQNKYKNIYFLVILLEDYDVVCNVLETNPKMKKLNIIIEVPRRTTLQDFLDYHHIYSFPATVMFDQCENILSVFQSTKTNNIIEIVTSGQISDEIIEVKQFLKICETINMYKTSVLTPFIAPSEKLKSKTIYQLLSSLRYFNYAEQLTYQGIYIELLSGRSVPEQLYDKWIDGVNLNKAYQQYARKQFFNQIQRLITIQKQFQGIRVFVVTHLTTIELERLSRFMSELKTVNVLMDSDQVLDKYLRNSSKRRRKYDQFDYCFIFLNKGDIAYQGPALENFIYQYLEQANSQMLMQSRLTKKGSQFRISGLKG